MPRRVVKKLAKPRGLLYLYGLLAVSWLISGYFIFEDIYLDAQDKAEKEQERLEYSLDERVQRDTQTGRMAYDNLFDPDEVIRDHRVGKTEKYLNVCDQASCQIMSGTEPVFDICHHKLSTSRKFHKYRVYSCTIKVTVSNDQPVECVPMTWQVFKQYCDIVDEAKA